MRKAGLIGRGILISVFFIFLGLGSSGQELTLKQILQRNLEASGGREKLNQVQNFSFETGNVRTVVSSASELKMMTGKEPVVTELILVKGDKVQKNSYRLVTDVGEPEKTVYQTLGKLYAGLFSLLKFEGELKSEGMKSYGPEKLYHLSAAKPGPVQVDFFLRPDDYRLKRVVFRGLTPEGDKYEVSYDFPPFEDVEGMKLPSSWFVSQVGTRGNLIELAGAKINVPLAEDFFNRLEVNIGEVKVSEGRLQGNVLDWSSRFGLTITTNWTPKDVEKAGLQTGDKLALVMDGAEYELVFYLTARELPPMNELARGARLMTMPPRGGRTYVIQFLGAGASEIMARLEPLTPIEVRKK